MHVNVRSTTQLLSLRLAPVKGAAYWIFGAAFIMAAFWTMSAMGHATVFACDSDSRCRLARRSLTGGSRIDIAASELRPARMDTTYGFVAGMQLVVVTNRAEYPLRLIAANGSTKDSLAGVINAYRANPGQPGFAIRDDARLIALLLGIVLIAAGVTSIVAIERTLVVFDRSLGLVRIRRKRWFGKRLLEMPLDQLEGVETRAFTFKQTRSWSVVLEFGGGHGNVPLTAMPMFTDASAEEVKQIIETWLPAS